MLRNQNGIALIATLWILAALVILAVGIGLMARTEAQVSYNFSSLVQCRWAARAGINRALIEIEKLKDQPTTYLGEEGLTLLAQQDDIDLGGASFEVVIDDEAGKININSAEQSILETLFGSRDAADSIIDWRDTDDQPQPLGAETQYYSGLKEPYRCKNKPFDTILELQLVKEITEDALSSPISQDGKTLADLLTVYSHDENTSVNGEERINIQTATKEQLTQKFGGELTERDIDAIIEQRGRRAFSKAGEVIRVPNLGRDKVSKIYDRITVAQGSSSPVNQGQTPPNGQSGNNSMPGLINVNTVGAEALAALPGMDEGIAQEIITYRQSNGAFEDVGKILNVAGVTDDAFARTADSMTIRSRVFKITATGRLEQSQVSSTVVCIVDASGDQVQTKYWRE